MSEQASNPTPVPGPEGVHVEKTEAQIALQIGRITDKLVGRALEIEPSTPGSWDESHTIRDKVIHGEGEEISVGRGDLGQGIEVRDFRRQGKIDINHVMTPVMLKDRYGTYKRKPYFDMSAEAPDSWHHTRRHTTITESELAEYPGVKPYTYLETINDSVRRVRDNTSLPEVQHSEIKQQAIGNAADTLSKIRGAVVRVETKHKHSKKAS